MAFDANSQSYNLSDKISSSEGLSQSTVNCILQDNDGFIWIGTQDGLNLYDGYRFTYFYNRPGDSTSLSDNYITSLCQSSDDSLWVGTMSGGLNLLDKKTGIFSSFQKGPVDKGYISDNTIWTICSDKDGNIYTGTNQGLNILNIQTGLFSNYNQGEDPSINPLPSGLISSLIIDSDQLVWVGTNRGLVTFSTETKSYYPVHTQNPDVDMSSLIFWTITENTDGSFLFGSNKGIFKSLDQKTIKRLEGSETLSTIWSLFPLSENDIYAGTRNGLVIWNKQQGKWRNISLNQPNSKEDRSVNVWSIIRDLSGLLWVGCDDGLLKLKPDKNSFNIINADPGNDLLLSGPSISSVMVDHEQTIWVGTDGQGLNRLDKGEKDFFVYTRNTSLGNVLPSNRIWALLEDSEGMIWIGTYGGGLSCFNKKTGTFVNTYEETKANNLSNNRVLCLYEDKKTNIWIGTRGGGLNKLVKKTGEIIVFENNPEDSLSLPSNTVLSLAGDPTGNLWIGTYKGGLSKYNEQTGSFSNYSYDALVPGSISNNNVWTIWFENNSRIWIGTQGGLNVAQYDVYPLKFNHITTKHGLPSNVIFGIEQDHNGDLWMSTFKGIARLNVSRIEHLLPEWDNSKDIYMDPFVPVINVYSEYDGIHGNEFNQGAWCSDKNGTIYFGGLTGMTWFHPDSIRKSDFDPEVVITGFKIFNHDVEIRTASGEHKTRVIKEGDDYFLSEKISYLQELYMTYRESVFSFTFSSLDFSNPERNRYAYIMEGFESDWNLIGNNNSATYTNLDPGEYFFRVKSTNSEGKWSTKQASLSIIILPPFWKTTWFLLLVSLVVLLILFFSIRQVFISQKKKNEAEKEKIELQLKTIKNQIDPHFAFNTINMIGSWVYKNDPDIVYDYFTRFARLIRSTLQDSDKISRPLKEELEFVKNYVELQKSRFGTKFDFELNISEGTDMQIEVPKMVIQTYAENAIKHGLMHKKGHGLLSLMIDQNSERLQISVIDNGVGRAKAQEVNKSADPKGMKIVQQIFGLYYKLYKHRIQQEIFDLVNSKGIASGTKVVLTIHLNKS